jgi:Bacteriophage CI repressor helix-turn-helix domain
MNLFEFEGAVLRLKEALQVHTDKEVAAALGLSEKAFNARKARGSFPKDQLDELKVKRQELQLDVAYVLTGQSDRVYQGRVAGATVATHLSSPAGTMTPGSSLAPDERELLDGYRGASNDLRKAALRILGGDEAPGAIRQVFKGRVGSSQTIQGNGPVTINHVKPPKRSPPKR